MNINIILLIDININRINKNFIIYVLQSCQMNLTCVAIISFK